MNHPHIIPSEIQLEAEKALSHFPGFKEVPITFNEVQSHMLAQPVFKTLLKHKTKREYQILIRRKFFVNNKQFDDNRIPFDILVSWLAHELRHIADYKNRSSLNLILFGIRYFF